MATEKVILEIAAQTADAQKKLSIFGTQATKTMKGIQDSLSGVKVLAAGVAGFFAGRALLNNLRDVTRAAAIQEDAINELNTSLRLSGKFSEETSQSFQTFASELQNVTTFGDEAILSNAALIQSLGQLDEKGLKRATTAAADLSAALNIDLRSAATLVGKAAAGEVGSFSRYGIVVKKGADNTETLARVLDEVEKKFSGAAASKVNTYSGAIQQLTNVQGDLSEELGFLITRNPVVIEGVKQLTKFFGELINVVKENQDGISDLVANGFRSLIGLIPSMITFFQVLLTGWQGVKDGVDLTLRTMVNFGVQFGRLRELATFNPLAAIQEALTGEELPNAARDFTREMKLLFDTIVQESDKPNESIEKLFLLLEQSKGEAGKLKDAIDKLTDKDVNVNIKTQLNGTDKGVSSIQKDLVSLFPANFGIEGPDIPRTESAIPKEGPAEDVRNIFQKGWDESISYISNSFATAMKDMKIGEIIGKGFQMALSGRQGAIQAVSAIGDALLPGIGGAITQLAQLGPEGAKAMIKEFATSFPEIVVTVVEALAASADVIIESLIDSLLVKGGLERIVVALIQAIPRVAYKLVESTIRGLNNGIVALSERFGLGITRAMHTPQWVEQLRDYVRGLTKTPEWMRKFQFEQPNWMKRLEELFNWLPNAIRKALPSVGGGSGTGILSRSVGGTTGKVLSAVGLKNGGLVYAANGFVPRGTDTVPAMLTPGERVLSVAQNESFEMIAPLLMQILSLLGQPITTNTTIEIDGNRLADVILELNRRNARIAA